MNILQVCSAREMGGGERHLIDLTHCLVDRGHSVYVAVVPGSPLITELSSLTRDHILELPMRNAMDFPSGLELARLARKFSVEIIHAHVGRDYPLAAMASWRSGNTPYVITRHVLFPLKGIHRLILRRVSRVIGVSQAVTESLRKQNVFSASTIVTIPNGIDTRRFAGKVERESERSRLKSRFRVGMVGHLAPIKGQEEFVRAAAIIAGQRADVDFVIAGEDKSRTGENRAAIERLIAQLDLSKRVQLLGWLDNVEDLLGTLDVFVSPSRSEPFGLALIEAMASGVPVVASMSEGSQEIVESDVTGRLVAIGDVEGLAKAIAELLANESERERFSVNALKAVQERFSLERMIDDIEQLYLDVVNAYF